MDKHQISGHQADLANLAYVTYWQLILAYYFTFQLIIADQ